MDTKGKVALVTGISRGMGKQMALRLARHGVNIVGVARTVEPSESEWPGTLKEAEREIRALGVEVLPVKCDLMVRSDVENLCKTALDKFGRVDFVVNNARYVGPELFDPFLEFEIDTWEKHVRGGLAGAGDHFQVVSAEHDPAQKRDDPQRHRVSGAS